ncbi:MAG TPA: peptide-methionine (R)-S-oxide reductase MsrB [Steroidobacteraceae bacterium]
MRKHSVPETSASGYDLRPLSPARREELAASLTPEERRVLLHQGTEPPFCGTLLHNKQPGLYACRLCGLPLFKSNAKFESGTGWPSFYEPFDPDHIRELLDESHGMIRTEIRCQRCDGHLGHVFEDGPPPTYKRYCLNSVSLEFFAEGEQPVQRTN